MHDENRIAIIVSQIGQRAKPRSAEAIICEGGGEVKNILIKNTSGTAFSIEFSGDEEIDNLLRKEFAKISDVAVLPVTNLKKKLLLADMDSTIIEQECLDELASFAGVKKQVVEITEKAMRGEIDFEEALRARVEMLKGIPLTALEQCWQEKITLSSGAKTLVQTMRSNGARCVLVSGGFTFFTKRVAELIGFDAHYGNHLLDDGKHLIGEVESPILGKDAKLQTLLAEINNEKLSLSDTLAIGDGANDQAMIEGAGLGIAVHAKPILAQYSDAEVRRTDLTSVLYFQGYQERDFVT